MINDRMIEIEEIEEDINKLLRDLLDPISESKVINKEAFDRLYMLLDKLKILIKGELLMSRKLAGLLFFIYTSLLSEVDKDKSITSVFVELKRLEEYVSSILWDLPFGQEL